MEANTVRTVAVVGAGVMGHGIAQEFACAGYGVRLHDLSEKKLGEAVEAIAGNLEKLQGSGLLRNGELSPILERIQTGTELGQMVSDADVIMEAVFEDLQLKQRVFKELDRFSPPHAILTSNTSALMPRLLAAATTRPDRVLVAHYCNPPYLLPLVEIVRAPDTSDEAVSVMCDLLVRIGKRPVIVQKETPGFIVNRLQAALTREALSLEHFPFLCSEPRASARAVSRRSMCREGRRTRYTKTGNALVERGIATPQEIDIVIKNGFGRRLATAGIFEIFELAGWDLVLVISECLAPHLESSTEPSPLLRRHVENGKLGVKSSEGFYRWTPESAEALRDRIAFALIEIAKWDPPWETK